MNLIIPFFYHPLAVYLVDDNQDYLDNLMLKLSNNFLCSSFTDAEAAANDLNKIYHQYKLKVHTNTEEESIDQIIFDFDLRNIRNIVFDKKRFLIPGCAIADYEMPRINGIEFAKKIPRKIKRVLLTGVADNQTAIAAFNENLIDSYIPKGSSNITLELQKRIAQLTNDYFLDLSEKLLANSENNKALNLFDSTFSNFFHQLIKENEITEYYLSDSLGGFLLLTKTAEPYWLAVITEEALCDYCDIAKMADNISDQIINKLESKKYVPYFFERNSLETTPDKWEPYLFPAQKIVGNQACYYVSLISKTDKNAPQLEKIFSFDAALHE